MEFPAYYPQIANTVYLLSALIFAVCVVIEGFAYSLLIKEKSVFTLAETSAFFFFWGGEEQLVGPLEPFYF